MRIILSLLVGLLVFIGVGMIRYNAVVAQDNRVAESRAANCRGRTEADLRAYPYGDPVCMRQAHEATMAERSTAHYIFGAWLWGAIAGVLGGLLAFMITGRRRRASAIE